MSVVVKVQAKGKDVTSREFMPQQAIGILEHLKEHFGAGELRNEKNQTITNYNHAEAGTYEYVLADGLKDKSKHPNFVSVGGGLLYGGGKLVPGSVNHSVVHYDDSSVADLKQRMSPAMSKGKCIGYVLRISEGGLCAGATSAFVEDGKFVHATAFDGQALQLVGSCPYEGVVILQGPEGDAFEFHSGASYAPLQKVFMLANPSSLYPDIKPDQIEVLRGEMAIAPDPCVYGAAQFSQVSIRSKLPGEPLLWNTKWFAGIYTGTASYRAMNREQRDKEAPYEVVDTDPLDMWPGPAVGLETEQSAKGTVSSADVAEKQLYRLRKVNHEAASNLKHGDELAMFVPAHTVAYCAKCAEEEAERSREQARQQ